MMLEFVVEAVPPTRVVLNTIAFDPFLVPNNVDTLAAVPMVSPVK